MNITRWDDGRGREIEQRGGGALRVVQNPNYISIVGLELSGGGHPCVMFEDMAAFRQMLHEAHMVSAKSRWMDPEESLKAARYVTTPEPEVPSE